MSDWIWAVLVLVALNVGVVLGMWWTSVFAARRIAGLEADLAELDHARWLRDEEVRDAADMALDGAGWP